MRAEPRREQSRAETEARQNAEKQRTEQRRRQKPAEFRAMNVNKREPELAGGARSYIGSARCTSKCAWRRSPRARNKTVRGADLAPLTPLTGTPDARSCVRRARKQHRNCGALKACGA